MAKPAIEGTTVKAPPVYEWTGGRPRTFETPEALQVAIDAYFEEQDEQGKPYTITGLGRRIGLDRQQLLNYSKDARFFDTIRQAKMRVHESIEARLYSGGQANGAIFSLKNNYGWQDKHEQVIDVNTQLGGLIATVIPSVGPPSLRDDSQDAIEHQPDSED